MNRIMNEQAKQEKLNVDIGSLVKLAIFLEGYKLGKGNLLPLGTDNLEQLWHAIKYLQGDVRYKCKEREDRS